MIGIGYVWVRFKRSDKTLEETFVPTLELTTAELTSLTQDEAKLVLHLRIDNPAPLGILIDSISYTIRVGGKKIITDTYNTPLQLHADTTSVLTVPLSLYYKHIKSIADQLDREGKDSTLYNIHAIIYSDMLPGKDLTIQTERLMPFIFVPEVRVLHVVIDNLTASGTSLSIDTHINNKNAFDLDFKNLTYEVQLENHKTLEGAIPQTVHIRSKDSTSLTIPIKLSFTALAIDIADLIRKGDKLRYKVTLKTKLETDTYSLKGSTLLVTAEGNLKQIKDATKK